MERPNRALIGLPETSSGLKDDVFELLATREAVEIPGHHAPAALGGRIGRARTVRRDQHIRQFMERAARRPAIRLGGGGVLPPDVERGPAEMTVFERLEERVLVDD